MKKIVFFYCFIFLLSGFNRLHAQDIEKKIQLELSSGYQQENLHWSIAGNSDGQHPNVLSELKWKNMSGVAYHAALQWNVWQRFVAYADYNKLATRSGKVSDIDYSGDNRTDPINTGNFNDNKGYTQTWNAGAGYIIFNNARFSLTPIIGYGQNLQNLYIVDLTGQFPGLNSYYKTNWKGAFIKLKSSLKLLGALKAAADITYHQLSYSAQGNWNLINEFRHPLSYSHTADGYGINANGKMVYDITPHIAISAGITCFTWQTGTGHDELYLLSGEVDKTQLNGVFSNGFRIVGGVVLGL